MCASYSLIVNYYELGMKRARAIPRSSPARSKNESGYNASSWQWSGKSSA